MQRAAKVKMIYQKSDEVIERIVKPLAIRGDKLICYDYYKRAQRSYLLSRVLAVGEVSSDYEENQ